MIPFRAGTQDINWRDAKRLCFPEAIMVDSYRIEPSCRSELSENDKASPGRCHSAERAQILSAPTAETGLP